MIRKITYIFAIILIIAVNSGSSIVLADEIAPTDTPVTVSQTQVDNTATAANTTDSTADTGNNTINPTPSADPTMDPTADPTSDPSLTPSPTEDPTITTDPTPTDSSVTPLPTEPTPSADPTMDPINPDTIATDSSTASGNSADIANTSVSTATTGNNTATTTGQDNYSPVPTDTPTPTPTPITVTTGDSVSIVAADNTINTTEINSDVTNQTINVYGDESGNIDLSTLFQLVNNIITTDGKTDPTVNVQVAGVNNYAYLTNNITSTANTGSNSVNTPNQNASITTGNADSLVSLINKVNLTVVNSSIHIVTINIFGHLTGNIILPTMAPLQSTSCDSCGVSFNTASAATVDNTVVSDANTGANTAAGTDTASITTGNVVSTVNTINVVNQTSAGMFLKTLFINTFGYWYGSFLGWDDLQTAPGTTLALTSVATNDGIPTTVCITCYSSTNVDNTAVVSNTISSSANTGNNTANGKDAQITTGNAFSAVSLINMINSSFLNTVGFFGFVNIFGTLDGNIGGADAFVTPTPQENSSQNQKTTQEEEGLLSVEQTNNTGAYVLPGDTVTFFVKVHNTGQGKVYGTKLTLFLTKDGHDVGSQVFDLGDIPVNGGVSLTTGLVLSQDAPAGIYTARAVASGTTGPNDTGVNAESDSNFTIQGNQVAVLGAANLPQLPESNVVPEKTVLSAKAPANQIDWMLFALPIITTSYVGMRGIQERKTIQEIFMQKASTLKKILKTFVLFL